MNHQQYLNDFVDHLRYLAKSEKTIISYLSDLKQYFNYYTEINRKNIQDYKNKISRFTATTFNRKMTSLKQFNQFLVNKRVIDDVVVYKQDYIPIQYQDNPTNVSEKTITKFLKRVANKECVYKSRNTAIVYLMAHTGIRREECCNLKLDNINLAKREMVIRGKRNKERKIALTKQAVEVIESYLRDRIKSKYAKSPYLFISERGEKLTKESINRIFNFYCTPKCKVTPHSLRHNYVTTMLQKGILSLDEIRKQVGHSSVLVTQRYLHSSIDNIKNKISDFSIV